MRLNILGLVLLVLSVLPGCSSESGDPTESGDPFAGIYEVTLQTGSDASDRPTCLDDAKTISDLSSVTAELAYFELKLVDEFGEPAPADQAVYYGFAECSSSTDCSEYFLLGSPSVETLTGTSEMTGFGFINGETVGECMRILFSSDLEQVEDGVVLEFVNDIVFVDGDSGMSLEEQELECTSNPPAIPADPCRRIEVLHGTSID